MKNKLNHQNKSKSQKKLDKNNSLQWPFGVFTLGKLRKTEYRQSFVHFSTALIASNYSLMRDNLTRVSHWAECENLYFHPLLNSLLDKMDACFFNYRINIWKTTIRETNKKQNKSIWSHVSNTGWTNNLSK